MIKTRELFKKIGLPPPSQIGVVVKDIERAVEYYGSVFGLGPFTVYEFVPDHHWYMEEPSHLKLRMGKAIWGQLELEFLQPLEGKSLHEEFLRSHGEGLQHMGINVRNYDEVFEQMKKEGFQPLMRAETYVESYQGHLRACYFDTRRVGGVIFEIIWKSWLPECL
jgi:methylmalonyl-CoA/ethylmalonyl-CoA epimerase